MSSSVLNKSDVVVSKCFEFFVQLLYQQSHSQIENSGKYFFNLDLKGTLEFILIKYLINILTTCLRGDPPKECQQLWLAPSVQLLLRHNFYSNFAIFLQVASDQIRSGCIRPQRDVFLLSVLEYDDNLNWSHWRKDNMTQHKKMLSRKYF